MEKKVGRKGNTGGGFIHYTDDNALTDFAEILFKDLGFHISVLY